MYYHDLPSLPGQGRDHVGRQPTTGQASSGGIARRVKEFFFFFFYQCDPHCLKGCMTPPGSVAAARDTPMACRHLRPSRDGQQNAGTVRPYWVPSYDRVSTFHTSTNPIPPNLPPLLPPPPHTSFFLLCPPHGQKGMPACLTRVGGADEAYGQQRQSIVPPQESSNKGIAAGLLFGGQMGRCSSINFD